MAKSRHTSLRVLAARSRDPPPPPTAPRPTRDAPGGGQYDCLSLYLLKQRDNDGRSPLIDLNRAGSGHVQREGEPPWSWPSLWEDYLFAWDPKDTVDTLCEHAGLPTTQLPPSSPEVRVVQVAAAFLATTLLDRQHWECRSGVLDTSGDDSGSERRGVARPVRPRRASRAPLVHPAGRPAPPLPHHHRHRRRHPRPAPRPGSTTPDAHDHHHRRTAARRRHMTARDEILAAASALATRSPDGTFTPMEVIEEMRRCGTIYADGTIRHHVGSRPCRDAPDH